MTYEQVTRTTPEEELLFMPFEIAEDVVEVQQELRSDLLTFTDDEIRELYGDDEQETSSERAEPKEPTTRNIGAIGILMVSAPEFIQDELEKESLHAMTHSQYELAA